MPFALLSAVWDARTPCEGASFGDTLLPPTRTRGALCEGAHPVQITDSARCLDGDCT
jgi:hypothetical protein